MTETRPCDYLGDVIAIAHEAGRKILAVYRTDFDVEHKDDRTPLTEADLAAHRTIIDGLKTLTPEIPALSEESAERPFTERSRWDRYWLIDPLDGTREFVKRNGEFSVNIAMIVDHKPVLGVVYAPVLDTTWYACEGSGAHKQANDEPAVEIRVRPAPEDRLVIAGSRSHGSRRLQAFLAVVGDHEFIPMGSSLKSCLVAEGRADVYPRLGPTSEWDTAAAQCVVEEAGGRITDLHFQPLRYNTKASLLNPEFIVVGDTSYDWPKPLAAIPPKQAPGDRR
jgi:3'(2'), 5'-bisphosphate nucleotidase